MLWSDFGFIGIWRDKPNLCVYLEEQLAVIVRRIQHVWQASTVSSPARLSTTRSTRLSTSRSTRLSSATGISSTRLPTATGLWASSTGSPSYTHDNHRSAADGCCCGECNVWWVARVYGLPVLLCNYCHVRSLQPGNSSVAGLFRPGSYRLRGWMLLDSLLCWWYARCVPHLSKLPKAARGVPPHVDRRWDRGGKREAREGESLERSIINNFFKFNFCSLM